MAIVSQDQSSANAVTYDCPSGDRSVTVKSGVVIENTNMSGGGTAVRMNASTKTLTNGGSLTGNYAIDSQTSNNYRINNQQSGYISGGQVGLFLGSVASVFNYGTIEADSFAILRNGGFSTRVSNYGMIRGDIALRGGVAGFTDYVGNYGTIDGGIECSLAATIENRGTISEDVRFFGGANVFDGRGGKVIGTIYGGNGDDTYIIDNASYANKIEEGGGFGTDTVVADGFSLDLSSFNGIENASLLGTGNFNLTGDEFDNVLTGNSGRNVLTGGLGSDTYYIQSGSDRVVEDANAGTDTVHTLNSYTLSDNVEDLVLDGAGNVSGTGNALANTITGNTGNNILDGRGGADTMTGGLGDDSYYIDNAQDKVTEAAGAGTDTVLTNVSYSVAGQSIETIILQGLNALTVTGSDDANTFYDNAGNDTLIGGNGNDTYYVTHAGDILTEATSGGTDTVHSTVSYALGNRGLENLTLDGTANTNATGNGLTNVIAGNAGANIINGGAGNDNLRGGGGGDTFVYHAGFGRDLITDFTEGDAAGHDVIQIDKTLFADYASVMAHTTDGTVLGHPAAAINYDAQNGINLLFVTKDSLTAADFKFV